jgi:DNA-binding transcriptional regulator YiaG
MYHFTDGGLRNIWLKNGYTEYKTPYGNGVSFHDLDGLVIAICRALCKKPGKLTGAEFRYIRNALLLSQKMLGQLVGYTEQAVAKWEKSGKIPKVIDLTIRLLFNERHDRNKKVATLIETLNSLDRASDAKIVIREERSKWISEIEVEPEPLAA